MNFEFLLGLYFFVAAIMFPILSICMFISYRTNADLERQLVGKLKDLEMSQESRKNLEQSFIQLANESADLKEKYVRPRGKGGRFKKDS